MTTISRNNVTINSPDTFVPSATGDSIAGVSFNQVTLALTLQAADLSDTTLSISISIEVTLDATGASGWLFQVGGTWVGGSRSRSGQLEQPVIGPYSGSALPQGTQRVRVHYQPSRLVTGVMETLTIT